MTLTEIMNTVTGFVIEGLIFSFWLFLMAALFKWFIGKVKLALNYLFPNCKYFMTKESEEK